MWCDSGGFCATAVGLWTALLHTSLLSWGPCAAEVGRELWRSSGPSPVLKQGHTEPITQDMFRWHLNISKDG